MYEQYEATFIQLSVRKEMRGRVTSLYTVTLIGLPFLGAMGGGAVLIGAILLVLILLSVLQMFWKRDLSQRQG